MPCWTVQENHSDLKNPDKDLFLAALVELGYTTRDKAYLDHHKIDAVIAGDEFVDRTSVLLRGDGTVTITSSESSHTRQQLLAKSNALRREYSRQVVSRAAAKNGFSLRWTNEEKTKFELRKRY